MTPEAALEYLYGLQVHGVKLGLHPMRLMLAELGQPQQRSPLVLVAGTNGKGSVVALVAAALRARGLRVGAYTSPHLVDFGERIRIDGEPLEPAALARHTSALRRLVERLLAEGRLEHHPTFFELTTALAWLSFAEAGCQAVVAEVGLGGRFDATNVSQPHVSVVTNVALEHTRYLGPTIEAIAFEKSGVARRGRPLVTAAEPPALTVLREQAAERGARLVEVARRWPRAGFEPQADGSWLEPEPGGEWGRLWLPLPGRHQRDNALLALSVLEALPAELRPTPPQVTHGLAAARWPGRLERLGPSRRWLLDGAHNPHAAHSLAGYLREFVPAPRCLVFASLEDKDVGSIAKQLFPLFERIVLTRVANRRAIEPERIRALVPPGTRCEIAADTAAAMDAAATGPEQLVVAGSLYLVGEARALLSGGHARAGDW